jgi:glycosyltransferase involved in cell wall biosynthesis
MQLKGLLCAKMETRTKKIVFIAPSMNVKGGISTMLKMYLKTDLPHRYDLEFVPTHEDGTKFHKVVVMLVGIAKFFYVLLTQSIDIVHIHCGDIPSPYRKYIFFKISCLFKLKVILHWHGGNFLEQINQAPCFWQKRLRILFERSDIVICLSQNWSDALGELFPKSNRIIVFNGIFPPTLCKKEKNDFGNPTRIVFLGLISQRKGIFDLIIVFERLVREGYDIRLSIGGNVQETKFKERISSPLLKGRIQYLGWIGEDQKDRLLASSDLFVLPSYGEAMPMSVLEAMAYGLAVISTQVGSLHELVEDGVTGFLVTPGDLEGLYNRVKTLIDQRDLRNKMGQNGRRKVEISFDIRLNYKAISDIYDRL